MSISLGLAMLAALSHDAGAKPDAGVPLLATPPPQPVGAVENAYSPNVIGGYGLRIRGQGYLYQGPRFDARIAPDGAVSFKDKQVSTSFVPFAWIVIPRVQRKPELLERSAGEASVQQSPWIPPFERAHPPRRTPEHGDLCPPGSSCGTPIPMNGSLIAVTESFDLTDEFMRGLGQDPYAREKARFLSATFEFRMKLALDASKQSMKDTLDFFPQRLEALWADTRYSPRERRHIIYQLWSQADSTPEGQRAAEMIDLFIKRRLPCGAPDGYTRAELNALRARHPDRRFAPGACTPHPIDDF